MSWACVLLPDERPLPGAVAPYADVVFAPSCPVEQVEAWVYEHAYSGHVYVFMAADDRANVHLRAIATLYEDYLPFATYSVEPLERFVHAVVRL